MFNHEPADYTCPFCRLARDEEALYNSQQDIIYEDDMALAFVSPRWWPNNKGNILIIPRMHFENIYDLPAAYAYRIQDIAREVAIALKHIYHCDGVSTRQHNEPYGGQDVWHYHLHVFPRYKDDNLYQSSRPNTFESTESKLFYASKLQLYFRGKIV